MDPMGFWTSIFCWLPSDVAEEVGSSPQLAMVPNDTLLQWNMIIGKSWDVVGKSMNYGKTLEHP